jgi:Tfp pilus assembly protein PilN
MRAVNLLPPERRQAAAGSPLTPVAQQPIAIAAGAAVLVTALVLGIVTHSASSSVAHKRRELANVQQQLAAARAPKDALSKSALARASERRTTILSLGAQRLQWDAFLGSVARVLPEDVWLVSLTASPSAAAVTSPSSCATSGGATTTTADTPFAICGYTYSQSAVARLMDRLTLIPWLSGVELRSATLTPLGNHNVFRFTIGASMTNAGGAS